MIIMGPDTKPMNKYTCNLLFGGIMFNMASNFLFIGYILFQVTHSSNYSTLVWQKNNLYMLQLSPLNFIFRVNFIFPGAHTNHL